MELNIGDIVRRNREYRGPDFGASDKESPYYYKMEGEVISKNGAGVPMVQWENATYDSYSYPNWKQSLIKVTKAKDMSLPDRLFEI